MGVAIAEPDIMAKKLGRPQGDRDDIVMRFDKRLGGMAKLIAKSKKMTPAAYLQSLTETAIERDYGRLMKDFLGDGK